MIITIDGPAKSGKSKAAELLAAKLGFPVLNTGAMYRAVGVALHDQTVDWVDIASIERFVHDCTFEMTTGVRLNGIDYTDRICSLEAGHGASVVGTIEAVRRRLQTEQKRIVGGGPMICEGRDQGTVVFPNAPVKFYVTASAAVRARRMALGMAGTPDLADLERQLVERDYRDMTRDLDPLLPATDAVTILTDTMTAVEVAEMMREQVEVCRSRFTR